MSLLKGVQARCTIPESPLNGRIRSAIITNSRIFIGQSILDCAVGLVAQARKSVGNVRRHLKFSIGIDYDEASHIAAVTVEVPARLEIPVADQVWYKLLQEKLQLLAPVKKEAKKPKKPKISKIEKIADNSSGEAMQKTVHKRNDWRR